MRRVTRNLLIAIAIVALALLALGALPEYLGTGDPYHLTAEPTDADGPAVDVSNATDRRYPYLTSALAATDAGDGRSAGRSDGYQEGPFGVKEHFTHTPFDEQDALQRRNRDAVREDGRVLVVHEGERYYVDVTRVPSETNE
ncbi:hypothetical protein [Halopenitus persicus]|uniref:Uncharacterized protein n=1 Tax=Halopenitus persicus TaxID=1048396 RepID=A0A1H3N169_9EURY|nr:hypothetical protein [Halopenitus persicus]QHS17740.1 hypothetical protein GWK26_11615 [haloarchaeon 3A1-DGR]SDY82504.1 hypothetical protein SAMN05216564_11115 [Halopenitus persicus]